MYWLISFSDYYDYFDAKYWTTCGIKEPNLCVSCVYLVHHFVYTLSSNFLNACVHKFKSKHQMEAPKQAVFS